MVASGLPISNGNLHAEEISTMALHFLFALKSFKIRHLPNEKLALRIGINSGMQVSCTISVLWAIHIVRDIQENDTQIYFHIQAQWLLELWVIQCLATVYLEIR